MIKGLRICNFQSHENTTIDFHPGLNAFTGTSRHGKSAIMRALLWALFDEPRGEEFIRHGQKQCDVHVAFDDGEFTKHRQGSTTYDYKGTTLKASGGIPEDIKGLVRMGDINVHRQHDPIFLLSMTEGQIARKLNEIVDLALMDQVMANINKMLRQTEQQRSFTEKAIIDEESTLAGLKEQIARIHPIQEVAEELNQDILRLAEESQELEKLLQDYQGLKDVDKVRLDEFSQTLKGAEELGKHVEAIRGQVATLERGLNEYNRGEESLVRLAKEIEQMKKDLPETCPTCGQALEG